MSTLRRSRVPLIAGLVLSVLSYAVGPHALTFVPYVVAGYVVLHGHTRRLGGAAQEPV